jgi:MinD superfamily P-loop ATPase
VAMVREMARKVAKNGENDLVLIDGPPGIGCPVIAAISGVSMVLVVTEPTLSGMHDLERVLGVAEHFGIPSAVIVNKADINEDNTNKIRAYCSEREVPFLGQLPYHDSATESMIRGQTLIEHADNPLAPIIKDMWNKLEEILSE